MATTTSVRKSAPPPSPLPFDTAIESGLSGCAATVDVSEAAIPGAAS